MSIWTHWTISGENFLDSQFAGAMQNCIEGRAALSKPTFLAWQWGRWALTHVHVDPGLTLTEVLLKAIVIWHHISNFPAADQQVKCWKKYSCTHQKWCQANDKITIALHAYFVCDIFMLTSKFAWPVGPVLFFFFSSFLSFLVGVILTLTFFFFWGFSAGGVLGAEAPVLSSRLSWPISSTSAVSSLSPSLLPVFPPLVFSDICSFCFFEPFLSSSALAPRFFPLPLPFPRPRPLPFTPCVLSSASASSLSCRSESSTSSPGSSLSSLRSFLTAARTFCCTYTAGIGRYDLLLHERSKTWKNKSLINAVWFCETFFHSFHNVIEEYNWFN